MPEGVKRKISAILSADVVGYSKLMEADEETTVRTMESYRGTISSLIQQHNGRVVDSPGDNILSEFPSVVESVQCAVEVQHVIKAKNSVIPEARRMDFRIGIHLGDVIEEKNRIYGDGVNIAARIEGLADAGGICISDSAYQQIETKLALGYVDLGEHEVKNISKPVRIYRIPMDSRDGAGTTSAKSSVAKKWRGLSVTMSVAVVLLIGLSAGWYLRSQAPSTDVDGSPRPAAPTEKPSIAVLPFDNMSGDPKQEYFSDGMTEEIISRLSKNSMLTVIARNSTFTYKGKAVRIQQVGQDLGVKHVLEGSVRRAGDRVRIAAQLVDADTGAHLWSETYEQEVSNVFAVHTTIAKQIAAALRVRYTEAEFDRVKHIPTEHLTAYDLFWRGCSHYYRLTKEATALAREDLERAIDLDPNYADAYAMLSMTHLVDYSVGWRRTPEVLAKAFDLSKRALSLDNSSIEAHGAQAHYYWLRGQFELSLRKSEKALSLDPNSARGYSRKGLSLWGLGKIGEAEENLLAANHLDPNSVIIASNLGWFYLYTGQHPESIEAFKKAMTMNPDDVMNYSGLAHNYLRMWITQQDMDTNMLAKATEMAEKHIALGGDTIYGLSLMHTIHLWRKQYSQALQEAEKMVALSPEAPDGYKSLSLVSTYTGRTARAVEMGERAVQADDSAIHPLRFAYRVTGRLSDALSLEKQSSMPRLNSYDTFRNYLELAILYSELGQLDEAKHQAQEALRLVPNFSVKVWGERVPYKDPAQAEQDMTALRKAGLK